MPPERDYSHAAFHAELNRLQKNGWPKVMALRAAFALVRKNYFADHPNGACPKWMAFPDNNRLRGGYNADGTLKSEYKKNPRPARMSATLTKQVRLMERFTEKPVTRMKRVKVPPLPANGIAVGRLLGVAYEVQATGEKFHHEFSLNAQPLLVVEPDARKIAIVGGRYAFTERGIVDRKSKR